MYEMNILRTSLWSQQNKAHQNLAHIWYIEADTKWPPFCRRRFQMHFFNENIWNSIRSPLKFVPKGPTHNIPGVVQIMAWSLGVKLTIFQYWFRKWLCADQTTSHYMNQWWSDYRRIYVSLGILNYSMRIVSLLMHFIYTPPLTPEYLYFCFLLFQSIHIIKLPIFSGLAYWRDKIVYLVNASEVTLKYIGKLNQCETTSNTKCGVYTSSKALCWYAQINILF